MERLHLPSAHFSLSQQPGNAVSHAWEFDVQIQEGRPINFFGLLVFADGPVDNEQIVKEVSRRIIDTLRYQQALLENNRVSITNDDFFEQCLQKVNAEISVFLHDISAPLPVHSWSMVIGMIAEDPMPKRYQFYVSRFGKVTGWLLNNAQLDTKKLISIFDQPDLLPAHQVPQKFFRNILSSSLPKSDQLFFCTPNLLNYISLSEIKNVLSTLSVSSAVKHFENQVKFRPGDHIVSGMTLKLSPFPTVASQPQLIPSSAHTVQDSINNLLHTQNETQKLLGSQNGLNLGGIFGQVKSRLATIAKRGTPNEVIPSAQGGRYQSLFAKSLSVTLRTGQAVFERTAVLIMKRKEQGPKRRSAMEMLEHNQMLSKFPVWKKYVQRAKRSFQTFVLWVKRSNAFKKPATYLVLIVLVVGLLGLRSLRASRAETKATIAAAETAVSEVRDILNRIDSHLIVGREADAVALVQSAESRLSAIEGVEEVTSVREELLTELGQRQQRLRKEQRLPAESVLLANALNGLGSQAKRLELNENSLLILGSLPEKAVRYTIETKESSELALSTDVNEWNALTQISANQAIILHGNSVTTLNLQNGAGTTTVANVQSNLVAGAVFNNRLYALSPQANQILRSNTAPNFSVFSSWISADGVSVSNARDLAIDGAIYVLEPNGVKQFLSGRPSQPGITLDPIDPPLEDAQKIATSVDTNRLYILEPSRLLVYEKTGRFVGQFLIEGANSFTDLAIDYENNVVFVLTSDQLYRLEV